ncbi:ABC transporter permease [Candidatus Korobacter versatilis]|nr:ABC transporter permease [Candidatus Koribacter versatilis]
MARVKQDLRYALRHLLRSPGFTVSAVITLALGIGANLVVFLLLYGVILRPLPFSHPEQLVRIARAYPGSGDSNAYSATKILFFSRTNRSFESVAGYDYFPHSVNLMEQQAAIPLQSLGVSSNFFHVFAMEPMLGHGFAPEDMQPGAAGVAVLSDATWRRQFNADPNIVGRAITLGSEKYTVVGVANPKFQLDNKIDIWTTLHLKEDAENHDNNYNVVARLKSGVTPAMAQDDLKRVLLQLKDTYPDLWSAQESAHVWDYHASLVGDVKPALNILMGAVGILLVVVAANILSLLLTRAISRRREMSVRVALGATGGRLLQQMLVENLLLCALGAVAGIALAQFTAPVILHLTPIQLPAFASLHVGSSGVAFAAGLAVLCAVLFSLVPALESRRVHLNDSLRLNTTRIAPGRVPAQRVLVVGEVAMSLVLLVAAALLLGSFWKLVHIAPGFDPANTATFKTGLSVAQTSTGAAFGQTLDTLAAHTEALPGVESAAAVIGAPMEPVPDLPFDIAGRPAPSDGSSYDEKYVPITADYFTTLKIPVAAGRAFTMADNKSSAPVLIVNEQFVHTYFPKENPIGQHVQIGKAMGPDFADPVREIVGVVGNVKQLGLEQRAPEMMYLPAGQVPDKMVQLIGQSRGMTWVVRKKSANVDLANALRGVFLDTAQLPIAGMTTMDHLMSDSVAQQRFSMMLLSGFGLIALFLGAAGLYGVMSYTVARQTKEIGVRMALGAARGDILRMVLREAGILVGIGLLVGVLASIAGGRLMSSMLFGVAPRDPIALLAGSGVLLLTGLFAAWWPARRAASTEPMEALRIE